MIGWQQKNGQNAAEKHWRRYGPLGSPSCSTHSKVRKRGTTEINIEIESAIDTEYVTDLDV